MTTPISNSSVTPFTFATNGGAVSVSSTRAGGGSTQAIVENASVSLDSQLGSVTAQTAAGQLTLTLAQILQSATTVDPSTGHREIADGANQQLATTLSSFLVANGFSEQQAAAGVSGLTAGLSEGGDINFSMAFQDVSSASVTSTEAYAGQSSLTSAAVVNERSGSVSIGIDLDTGQLSVSLTEQSGSTYGLVAQTMSATGPTSATLGGSLDVPGVVNQPEVASGSDPQAPATPSPLSESVGYSYVAAQESTASSSDGEGDTVAASTQSDTATQYSEVFGGEQNDTGLDLFNWLSANSKAKTFHDDDATSRLAHMASLIGQPEDGAVASEEKSIESAPAPVKVGFSQVVSVQQLGVTGHGTTVYQRPDGTVAAMTSQPLDLSA